MNKQCPLKQGLHIPTTITYAGQTDIGQVRETNEDAF